MFSFVSFLWFIDILQKMRYSKNRSSCIVGRQREIGEKWGVLMVENIITIARQYGSGGHEIGEKVSQALGIPFYDRELIVMAAKQSGYSEEVFSKADERATNSLLYSLLMGYSMGGHAVAPNEMPINDKLFLIQSDIIKQAALRGAEGESQKIEAHRKYARYFADRKSVV